MTHTWRKTGFLLVALIHLFGSIGYAGLEHYCRHQQEHAVTENCCCATGLHEAKESCCGLACILTPETIQSSGQSFHNQGCCELVSFFHQVKETAHSTPSAFLLPTVTAFVLLPPENNDKREIKEPAAPSLAALQLCLPLLN